MIRGVAFDLEGTIVDVESCHHQAHIAAAAEIGVTLVIDTALKKLPHFVGGPDEAVADDIYELSDNKSNVEHIVQRKRFHYRRLLGEIRSIAPRKGFLEVYAYLAKAGIVTSIGSLTPMSQASVLLKRSGLDKIFNRDRVVLREVVNLPKPAPDVYVETARRMNVSPSEQVVFEDSENGIRAARNAGSTAIAIPTIRQPEFCCRLLKAGARCVFLSWNEMNIEQLLVNLNQKMTNVDCR